MSGWVPSYNHFDSKEELFQAAVNEVLDELGAILDKLTGEGEDPARPSPEASGWSGVCSGGVRRCPGCFSTPGYVDLRRPWARATSPARH